MRKIPFLLLSALILWGGNDASANMLQRAGRRAPKKAFNRAMRQMGKKLPQASSKASVEKLLRIAAAQAADNSLFNLKEAQRSIFYVQSSHPKDFAEFHAASGFVFQTQYNGQTEIWGVMAQHVVDLMDEKISAVFHHQGKRYVFPGTVVLQGTRYRADVALIRFKLTPEFLSVVRPLTLAEENAAMQTEVTSYGYSKNSKKFFSLKNRKVLCSGGICGGTTTVPASQQRAGTCGSPLIDDRGLVVGVHCGTPSVQSQLFFYPQFFPVEGQNIWPILSKKDRVAHFVQAHVLRNFVKAYHEKIPVWPVRWNGVEITRLRVDEYIEEVASFGKFWRHAHYRAGKNEAFLDEAHLEKFVNPGKGSVLKITIRGTGTVRTIGFNIKTQKVVPSPN